MINPITILIDVLTDVQNPPRVIVGSWEEIAYNIASNGIGGSTSTVYPIIVIPTGYKYNYGNSLIHECIIDDMPIYLLVDTKSDVELRYRYDSVYKETLYPFAERVEKIILKSNKIDLHEKGMNQEIKKTIKEFPFDMRRKSDQNKLKDIVDCLELTYNTIRIKKINFKL